MVHYLLLKFNPGFFSDEVFSLAVHTYTELESALPGIEKVQIYKNCVCRNSNADLLVKMDLASEAALSTYLKHPLHCGFIQEVGSQVSQRITFDRK